MSRIRIIKKNDEYSSEYEIGDIFEIQGTWYGGVHITGKSGVPISLDKEEYQELDTEPEPETEEEELERDICEGDIVQHFKREWVSADTSEAHRNRRAAGHLPGALCAVQGVRKTLCHVHERGGQGKVSGHQTEIPVRESKGVRRWRQRERTSCTDFC